MGVAHISIHIYGYMFKLHIFVCYLRHIDSMELLDPVDPKCENTYLMDNLPKRVPLYRPEGVTFVKFDSSHRWLCKCDSMLTLGITSTSRNSGRSKRE